MPARKHRSQHSTLYRGGVRPSHPGMETPTAKARRAALEIGDLCYFASIDGLVKIGTSGNLMSRLGDLGVRLGDILWVEPGGREREAELHAQFSDYRVWGERFRPCDAIDDYISQRRSAAGF